MRKLDLRLIATLLVFALFGLIAGGSIGGDDAENSQVKSEKEAEDIETVLVCQSRKFSTDYRVIGLYSKAADIIAFSKSGVFKEGSRFNASISKSDTLIKIRHYYYDKGYNINRQNLTLYSAKTITGVTKEPFVISSISDCRVASIEDYQKARNALEQKEAADKKQREKIRQDAIKNQKI